MHNNRAVGLKRVLLAGVLASSILVSTALAQLAQGKENPGPPLPAAPSTVPHSVLVPSIANSVTSAREALKYRLLLGIDDIHIRSIALGSLIRFSYRVVDAEKAKILTNKTSTAYLIDENAGLALQVPVLENIGQLRQVATPQNGREYWMAFSNKGHIVKPGNRVDLRIGNFRAEGLVVEGVSSSASAPSK